MLFGCVFAVPTCRMKCDMISNSNHARSHLSHNIGGHVDVLFNIIVKIYLA